MSAPPTAPLIEFNGAALGYQGRPVLRDVALSIEPGSFWGVLGANGSGKTTILKTLLGLIPPVRGAVHVREARFGYVPQKERLDPIYPLSGFDVAAMGAWRRFDLAARLRPGGDRSRIARCLSDCGATGFAGKPFSALSGGQKQRVLIARALAADPQILVLDEPLAGIDAPTQTAVLELLERLKQERDLTVLMVSHRIRAEKALFTHIAWVDEGRVTAGPAAQMLKQGRLAEAFRGEL